MKHILPLFLYTLCTIAAQNAAIAETTVPGTTASRTESAILTPNCRKRSDYTNRRISSNRIGRASCSKQRKYKNQSVTAFFPIFGKRALCRYVERFFKTCYGNCKRYITAGKTGASAVHRLSFRRRKNAFVVRTGIQSFFVYTHPCFCKR